MTEAPAITDSTIPPAPVASPRRWRRVITRRVLPVVLVLGAVLFYFREPLFLGFELPQFEAGGTISVIVDDEAGERVVGAQLTQHGLRSVLDPGSAYGWIPKEHGERVTVTTDEAGRADIPYPKWVSRATASLTGAVIIVAEHPNYCLQWNADCPVLTKGVVARTPHITLKRGGRLRIKASREGETTPLTDFQAMISGQWFSGRWQTDGDARLSPVIDPGPRVFRIVDRTDPERLQFSDALEFTSTAGQTADFDVTLRSGMSVRGKLDPSVARPVKNGFVIVAIHDEPTSGSSKEGVTWQTWVKVSDEGEFEFPSLPNSKEVRFLAWCDGFVSKLPDASKLPANMKPTATSGIWLPQFFTVEPAAKYEIAMEPAAQCQVTVTTTMGQPVEGASIYLFPNVSYDGRGNTMFGWTGRSEVPPQAVKQSMIESLRRTENRWDENFHDPNFLNRKFSAVTDKHGQVLITDLPGRSQTVDFEHEQWTVKGSLTPPFRSEVRAALHPGQTTSVNVVVVPKPRITDKLINPPPVRGPSLFSEAVQVIRTALGF